MAIEETFINSGIVQNGLPVSDELAAELEKEVLSDSKCFAYIDKHNKVAVKLPCDIRSIKDLAWSTACEIQQEGNEFIKKIFARTGTKTYEQVGVYKKTDVDEDWTVSDDYLVGNGQTFYLTAPNDLTFRYPAATSELETVRVNNKILSTSNYSVNNGTVTSIQLNRDYLNALDAGEYSISLVFNNKTVDGTFFVYKPVLNKYGFYFNQLYVAQLTDSEGEVFNAYIIISDVMLTEGSADIHLCCVLMESSEHEGLDLLIETGVVMVDNAFYIQVYDTFFEMHIQENKIVIDLSTSELGAVPEFIYAGYNNQCAIDEYNRYTINDHGTYTCSHVSALDTLGDRTTYSPILPEVDGRKTTVIAKNGYQGRRNVTIKLPETIETIGRAAFTNCIDVDIWLPSSLKTIGGILSEDYTDSITRIRYHVENINTILSCTFESDAAYAYTPLFSPYVLYEYSNRLFVGEEEVTSVTIPEHINELTSLTLNGLSSLVSISFPKTTTRITSALNECINIAEIFYAGTCAEWLALPKDKDWNKSLNFDNRYSDPFWPATHVQCSDGKVRLRGSDLEGDSQEFNSGAPSTLSFRSEQPLEDFQELQVNGEVVAPEYYTLEEGSTIVHLCHEYLSKLSDGEHSINVVSKKASVEGKFKVISPHRAPEGFYYNLPYYAGYLEIGDPMMPNFNGTIAFYIKEDNTVQIMNFDSESLNSATFNQSGSTYTISDAACEFSGYFSEDGKTFIGTRVFAAGGGWCPDYEGPGVDFKVTPDISCADDCYLYVKLAHGCLVDYWKVQLLDPQTTDPAPIKDNIQGVPVRALCDSIFSRSRIRSVPEMPETITSFGHYAFNDCDSLTKVVVPDHITYIGGSTFRDCLNLMEFIIPTSVTRLGDYIFDGSYALDELTYLGTRAEWDRIEKSERWNSSRAIRTVSCSDGKIYL